MSKGSVHKQLAFVWPYVIEFIAYGGLGKLIFYCNNIEIGRTDAMNRHEAEKLYASFESIMGLK